MIVSEKKTSGITVVIGIRGKIYTDGAEQLLDKLNALIEQGERHLLLDFSGVDYINSSGLGALLSAAKRLKGLNGKMALANVSELVDQVLRISGCASVIGIYPSQAEALTAIEAKDPAVSK